MLIAIMIIGMNVAVHKNIIAAQTAVATFKINRITEIEKGIDLDLLNAQ